MGNDAGKCTELERKIYISECGPLNLRGFCSAG